MLVNISKHESNISLILYSMKATTQIPKVKVLKPVGRSIPKTLFVVVSNYCQKGYDTVLMEIPTSGYVKELFKN